MSHTIITTTTTTTKTTSSKQGRSSRFKNFLNRHCYIVDFLSATITIVLCLTILLPRVHHSFLPTNGTGPITSDFEVTNDALTFNQTAEQLDVGLAQDAHEDGHHHHHHHHRFPTAELLICIGFFVFYCAGLSLAQPQATGLDQDLYLARQRKQSTCCTTSRCSGSNNATGSRQQAAQASGERVAILGPSNDQASDSDDCLMLINPHHQHHTHAKLHGYPGSEPRSSQQQQHRANYGTTQTIVKDPERISNGGDEIQVAPRPGVSMIVDEIRISSGLEQRKDQWPNSLGFLLFSVILAFVLVFFDMNVLGMMRAVKVFRATSTGALLYVAFFIMLPSKKNHCNSCEKEEEEAISNH